MPLTVLAMHWEEWMNPVACLGHRLRGVVVAAVILTFELAQVGVLDVAPRSKPTVEWIPSNGRNFGDD